MYATTADAQVVFITDREAEAWDWATFADEMGAPGPALVVVEVEPRTPPQPVRHPERHPDGRRYSEYTTGAAIVTQVIGVRRRQT